MGRNGEIISLEFEKIQNDDEQRTTECNAVYKILLYFFLDIIISIQVRVGSKPAFTYAFQPPHISRA